VPVESVVVVPSGVAVEHFARSDRAAARSELGIDPERPVVAIVGSLHARKGHAILFEALVRLRADGREVLCLAAGEGPEREILEARARQLGIAAQVRLLGHLPDVLPILAAADVVAQPSLAEGLGVAAVEGMASGRPVVASRVGGLAETIRHEVEGLLVPPGDPHAFGEALERLLADRELRERLGTAGRQRAARFSTQAMARGTESVYERALARRGRRA